MKKLGTKFWLAMLIFGIMGQVAWVVENMYFNVFIYKMFNASASDISIMVMASAVMAALATIIMGAVSDKLGKRKAFMSWGIYYLGLKYNKFRIYKKCYTYNCYGLCDDFLWFHSK